MTKIAVYRNCGDNGPDIDYVAYVVLPDGNYWGVRFNGSTEDDVKQKAIALWNAERAKWLKRDGVADPWADVKAEQHHLANKVWMIHNETREKKRVALTEITLYEKNGYVCGGPRSK